MLTVGIGLWISSDLQTSSFVCYVHSISNMSQHQHPHCVGWTCWEWLVCAVMQKMTVADFQHLVFDVLVSSVSKFFMHLRCRPNSGLASHPFGRMSCGVIVRSLKLGVREMMAGIDVSPLRVWLSSLCSGCRGLFTCQNCTLAWYRLSSSIRTRFYISWLVLIALPMGL